MFFKKKVGAISMFYGLFLGSEIIVIKICHISFVISEFVTWGILNLLGMVSYKLF